MNIFCVVQQLWLSIDQAADIIPPASMAANLTTPPRRVLRAVPSVPESVVATQGSPCPSLEAETLVLGDVLTPPKTFGPSRHTRANEPLPTSSGSKDKDVPMEDQNKISPTLATMDVTESMDLGDLQKAKSESLMDSKDSKSQGPKVPKAIDWKEKWSPDLVPMMMADTDSEEECPENIRLICRINRLRQEYRDLQSYNKSYRESTESWKSFKEGNLADAGWVKRGNTWTKEGSVPPVDLPKSVLKQINEPGLVMPISDIRYLEARNSKNKSPMKAMKSMKRPSASSSSTKPMRKPAAAKGQSKVEKTSLKNYFKKPAASK